MELGYGDGSNSILRRMGKDENGNWYHHDLTARSRSLSTSLVLAVSDVTGEDVQSIKPPLSDVVDPDSLDTLFHTPPGGTGEGASSIDLHFGDRDVTVFSDGWICISE